MSFRHCRKPVAPIIVQAPELVAVNAPTEEGVTDVLKTVIPVPVRLTLNQLEYQR